MMVQTRSNKFAFLLRINLPDFNLQNHLLVVSTRLSCFSIGNFKRGLSPALSPTNCKFNKNRNNTQPLLRKSCRIPHYKCIHKLKKHVSSYFRCKGIEYSRTIQVHNGSIRKKCPPLMTMG